MRKAVIASRSGGGPDAGQRKCSASYQRAGFAKNTLSRKPIRSPCAPYAEARKRLIDGRLLGTVAANLSASGLKRQNYDSIVIECAEAAVVFKRAFDARFACREALSADAKEWALTLPSSDRVFRRILSRNCFHALATLQQGIDHIGNSFEFGCE